ncbi:MAG: PQQ-binding-like beta-propeller repeat protein [Bdellovibrionaceae bacterium]|nr:PQQ-binding-like beta-propeller repeat protein [Bdellovibrionales bacterium]MCB9254419.1 PQQ-binding-like beta-propeller repeat protein [Pseudobdellovibrionaceae bacterium]
MKRILLLNLVLFVVLTGCGDAESTSVEENGFVKQFGFWPSFRGPEGDGISDEKLANQWPDPAPAAVWEKKLGGGYSSFSVAEGRVYTMSRSADEEIVHCWDAHSGRTLWEHKYEAVYRAFADFDPLWHSGPRATPTIDGDRLYTLGSTGILKCLRVDDGTEVWSLNLFELSQQTKMHKFGYSNSPVVVGRKLLVEPGGTNKRSLAAIDKLTGKILWLTGSYRYGYATPIYFHYQGEKQVVYFTGEGPVSVRLDDGSEIWRYIWETELDINVATPIFHKGRLFISSAYGRGAALLKLNGKNEPELIWKKNTMANYFSSSVIFNGNLYGFSMGRLRCLDLETGAILWDEPGLGRGSLLIADNKLIALGERGVLAIANATPSDFDEIYRWKALDGGVWNVPVLAAGKLFIRSETEVKVFDARYP